jgi:hypothetical protein
MSGAWDYLDPDMLRAGPRRVIATPEATVLVRITPDPPHNVPPFPDYRERARAAAAEERRRALALRPYPAAYAEDW